ncbi:hypothetical protein AGMMS49991_05160 [Spirochaetia bacterium]|nr:hypothetical protein AGMMS49991_05160 [Spirochaetia bacterium]
MPSLKQLEAFKTSFLNVGNEAAALRSARITPDDYPLPESEPAGLDPFTGPGFSTDMFQEIPNNDFTDLPASEGDSFSPLGGEGGALDFSAFLDTIPDDLSAPPTPDETIASAEFAGGNSGEGLPGAGTGEPTDSTEPPSPYDSADDSDFGAPGDLLTGFADDISAASAGAEQDGTSGGNNGDELILPGINDFDDSNPVQEKGEELPGDLSLPVDDFGAAPGGDDFILPTDDSLELPNVGDFTLPTDDSGGDDFTLSSDDLGIAPDDGGFSLSTESFDESQAGFDISPEGPDPAAADFSPKDDDGSPADSTEIAAASGDLELPGGDAPDLSIPAQDDGALLPPNWNNAPGGEAEAPPDSFDSFNLERGAAPAVDFNPGSAKDAGSGAGLGGADDFAIDNVDALLSGTPVKVSGGGQKAGDGEKAKPEQASTGLEDVEVEEIILSEEDFERLKEAIDSYPLNLRIACEEIIAEEVVDPELMSALIKLLVRKGTAREAAVLARRILGRTITIPKGFEKKTGAELEAEQSSFGYIFVHKLMPVAAFFLVIMLVAASVFYLVYQFIYIPIDANSIYKRGYERIAAGEYERANDLFTQAFRKHRVKKWFYRYAEKFRDEPQYIYAEEKYEELLRNYPRDKKGVLDYADLETKYLRNYPKAERIIRSNILDYAVDDKEGLLALGDNFLAWGETDSARYEDARSAYAQVLERYGWLDPVVERMLLYFIKVDNLGEVISMQQYFDPAYKRKISSTSLSEMGGYLLDKRLEESPGVPDANIERIQGLRDLLIRAVEADRSLPESHYHLARYYHDFGGAAEERQTLERAARVFDNAQEENSNGPMVRRIRYRIDTERRLAQVLINAREYFPAEEHLNKGIGLYENALNRRMVSPAPEYGRLYADLGDLEYFTKSGDMETALLRYRRAEQNLYAPPEIQYRMGAAHYQLGDWENALKRFFEVSGEMPLNRRLLHALGNVSFKRGNFFAAQGYFQRLLNLLDNERARFSVLYPGERPDHLELAERMMTTQNNLGVVLEALTERTGNLSYRSNALGHYAESSRAWDGLTRDPNSMVRVGAGELSSPGVNLAYLNSRNALYPQPDYEPQLYGKIDKDVLEPSAWEERAPSGYHISGME